jgi:hypothetical protein
MAENLFVYHQHGATFTSEEKRKLIASHMQRLNQKHPGYVDIINVVVYNLIRRILL